MRASSIRPSPMIESVIAATAFEELRVSVSIQWGGTWRAIHWMPSVNAFEVERGNALLRYAYNERCLARARAGRRPVLGRHAGFCDIFVPIVVGPAVDRVLVAGPFAVAPPTAHGVADRWYRITHARAHFGDPAFSRYLAATLDTLTLEGPLIPAFERLLSCFALLLGGTGDPQTLAAESEALKQDLLAARSAERMWEDARSMVDDRTAHTWSTPLMRDPLVHLHMKEPAEHAVVGLLRPKKNAADPIDEALRRRAFQRAVTHLAWKLGDVACGQVGDHGVALLACSRSSGARTRQMLEDLARRLSDVARRFGFALHAGIAVASPTQSLPSCYRAALTAADSALSQGVSALSSRGRTEPSVPSLSELRASLTDSIEASPDAVLPRFERYIAAVVANTGGQLDATRAHLEVALDCLAEPLLSSGRLDRRSFGALSSPALPDREVPSTLASLIDAYRRVVSSIAHAAESPTDAHRARSAERALAFVREHLAEPLTLARVARVAGYAPDYFSRLVRRAEGVTFGKYVGTLRVERAKHMLTSTSFGVGTIARRVGYESRTYFQRMFRQETAMTPIEYRRRTRPRSASA
jgi:AraC-like DNA-binding protein